MNLSLRKLGIAGRAAEWFARLRGPRWDSQADKSWEQWMSCDARNAESYDEAVLAWELTEELRERPLIKDLLKNADSQWSGGAGSRGNAGPWGLKPAWGVPAALAALVLIGLAITFFALDRTTFSEYATAIGEQRTVTLADSSAISMNTATHVRVSYSRRLRSVELVSGEAVFSVRHDARRPFVVHALGGTTTAVGTEFDVQIAGGTTAVTVLQGSVKVRSIEKSANGPATDLGAGQALDYTSDGVLSPVRKADADKVRGWLAQRIVFSNLTLSDALADYNRYIKVPIVLGDPSLRERRINGVFRVGDQSAFLNALEQGLHVNATTTESGIVLRPR